MRNFNVEGQASLFDPDTSFGKMFPEPSPAEHPRERTSASSWRRSSGSKTIPVMCLDLTPGHGNLLGQFDWEWNSPWLGEWWTLNTGVSPREERESSLWQILEALPPTKYYLTPTACKGILKRAQARGKPLPEQLETALTIQAGLREPDRPMMREKQMDFAANQRETVNCRNAAREAILGCEVRDLHGKSGALATTHGNKQSILIASFSAGAGASAGGIGFSEVCTPTLKGSASGNSMPSVLCLNDQGGQIMEETENITGTLRAQCHGHLPLVYENHGVDSRYTGPYEVSPTLSARGGTGGNNLPLVKQSEAEQEQILFRRRRVDQFVENPVAGTESARQGKDATDLVMDRDARLIRRLSPLECERLQGFPDGWTNIPRARDSPRYKALGNSVAMPCVEFILGGVGYAARTKEIDNPYLIGYNTNKEG